jgi:predicted acetylornithine/succinylornithine family transaminase
MDEIRQLSDRYHFNVYRRLPVVFSRGKGSKIWDTQGRKYIDFLAGISVNSLGHNHPEVLKAIRQQATKLIHISNIYYSEPQTRLAELLCRISGYEKVFFCNSGLEANEAAIKIARRFGVKNNKSGNIFSFTNCFHGRSISGITMGSDKYKKGFGPFPEGFGKITFNDTGDLRNKINHDSIAVFVEPVQGEGGIIPATPEFMRELVRLCRENNVLLICDEIQCGIGRTGKFFAFEHFNIRPDIVTVAKSLGGGIPIGAVITDKNIAELFEPGDHGSTFGGNPLACASSHAVLSVIQNENLIERVRITGNYFLNALKSGISGLPGVREIRGIGLMLGVEMEYPCRPLVEKMLEKGFLINCTSEKTLRFLPPFIISTREIDVMLRALKMCILAMNPEPVKSAAHSIY